MFATKPHANPGDTVTLTATPATGYQFEGWRMIQLPGDGSVAVNADGTFTMPSAAVSVTPIFTLSGYYKTSGGAAATVAP